MAKYRCKKVPKSDFWNKFWSQNISIFKAEVSFSSCQRNLIKTFQMEAIIALITKMAMIFSWVLLSGQKKPNFLEILGTKVVQFWCYTKLIKTKKLPLNWYFSICFFRKIRMIFDLENRLWKSDFGTFWRLFLAI